jgi:sucrose-6-phosphate hydrolase SacC (GH32 family)
MEKRIQITVQEPYLVFPIRAKQEKAKFFIVVDGKPQIELNIPMGSKDGDNCSYDFFSYLPVKQYIGKEIILQCSQPDISMEQIHTVSQTTALRKNRPLLHFTPDYGWINDPNGLVYQNGWYHLYFQYNPFDTEWDNMSWGHAVSKDLLHWEQKDTVLFPDEDGTIFSGCGLVNDFGLFGLPKDALLFVYSAAGNVNELSKGKTFVQKLAYSLDGGMTFLKKQIILPTLCKENRDPKIFWHGESNAYIMCLWLENNEFAIFRSVDLENWNISQRFSLDKGFECPDLFPLSVDQDIGNKKWVFWCADGFYYIGTFDGYEFSTDGIRKEAYCTKLPYAAQTISNTEERILSIPWLRTKTVDHQYTGTMGLPREFSLVTHKGDVRLRQCLAKEIEENQKLVYKSKPVKNQEIIQWKWGSQRALKINLKMAKPRQESGKGFYGHILGFEVNYDAVLNVFHVQDNQITMEEPLTDICILVDGEIIEITANNDVIYAVFEGNRNKNKNEIVFKSNEIEELKLFQLL